MRVGVAIFAGILFAACAGKRPAVVGPAQQPVITVLSTTAPPTPPGPTLHDIWQITLLSVTPLAQRGDFLAADSALAIFANNHGGTCESAESEYVRALLRLSSHNPHARVEGALPLLDAYLSSGCLSPGRAAEALLVRRIASDLVRQNFAGDSASAEEIRKLKEQLELTKKELDRLKMRVIPPSR